MTVNHLGDREPFQAPLPHSRTVSSCKYSPTLQGSGRSGGSKNKKEVIKSVQIAPPIKKKELPENWATLSSAHPLSQSSENTLGNVDLADTLFNNFTLKYFLP